jgi:hypothetical protein
VIVGAGSAEVSGPRADTGLPPDACAGVRTVCPPRLIARSSGAFGSHEITTPSKKTFSQLSLFFIFLRHWTRTLTPSSTPRRKEAHQMVSPRWLAGLIVPVMAGAALVTSAAIANADATDDAYLSQLRAAGFSWPPDHNDALTGVGRLICDDIGSGWTYDQLAQQIHTILDPRNVTFGEVRSMVSLAHSTYCPDQPCLSTHC